MDRQAKQRFDVQVEQMAASEGVTEQLKAVDQMRWVEEDEGDTGEGGGGCEGGDHIHVIKMEWGREYLSHL